MLSNMLRTRAGLAAMILALGTIPVVAGDTKTGDVPFEMLISNHMVVTAKINGKGPYRLIFDVGAPITLLSNRAAEGSGVLKKSAPKSFLFAMRGEATVKSLEVGTLKAKDLPVVVLDHPALSALGDILGKPLDGIIGFTFFARYKTTIDYQKEQMTFEPVDYKVKNLMKDLPDRLGGAKVARRRMLAPSALMGFHVGKPAENGVKIVEVLKQSPAEAAGLLAGDVLTVLDGRWTTSEADTLAAAAGLMPGKKTDLTVVRDGKEMALSIVPAEGL